MSLQFFDNKNWGFAAVIITIQRIWIVLGRCLFTTRRGVLEKSFFFNQFYWSEFWSGKWNAWKTWSDFGAEQKWKAERKESGFCSYRCFWESEKLICEKNFSKRAKFFCSRAAFLKQFFANSDGYEVWLWYYISFRLAW